MDNYLPAFFQSFFMQLCARDKEKRVIYAHEAAKQQDYFCLECSQVVRVRRGMHRKAHYYHLTADPSCYQNGKSLTHLQIQWMIKNRLPSDDCTLENHFEEINRIADLVWWSKKIVFEIQCSFISAEEIAGRNTHYNSIGFRVVWILHDQKFNREYPSAAEWYLQSMTHYFTNINEKGEGRIYDQYGLIVGKQRIKLSDPFTVDLLQPLSIDPQAMLKQGYAIPSLIAGRFKNWKFSFQGDCLSFFLENGETNAIDGYFFRALQFEQSLKNRNANFLIGFIRKWVIRPYCLLFQIVLEKFCR